MSPTPVLLRSDMDALLLQENRGDEYWKLPQVPIWYVTCSELKQSLKAAGRHVPSGSKKQDMVKIAHRQMLQRPEYKYCTIQELRKFRRDRRIPGTSSKTTKTTMIASLRQADQNLSFHRFSELPAELRCCVYDEYIAYFPYTLNRPMQPPLARVDRCTRREVLPLFYRRVEFVIAVNVFHRKRDRNGQQLPPTIRFCPASRSLLRRRRTENISAIRRWKLYFYAHALTSFIKIDTVSKMVTAETTVWLANVDRNSASQQISNNLKEILEQTLQQEAKSSIDIIRSIPRQLGKLKEARLQD